MNLCLRHSPYYYIYFGIFKCTYNLLCLLMIQVAPPPLNNASNILKSNLLDHLSEGQGNALGTAFQPPNMSVCSMSSNSINDSLIFKVCYNTFFHVCFILSLPSFARLLLKIM